MRRASSPSRSIRGSPASRATTSRVPATAATTTAEAPPGDGDVLVVSGSLPFVPPTLREQVRVGGRMVVIVGDAPAMSAELHRRTGPDTWTDVKLFETVVRRLREAPRVSRFSF